MRNGVKIILIWTMAAGSRPPVSAQTAVEEDLLDNGAETVAPETLERLEEWKRFPLNLNGADAGEISMLPMVSPSLARAAVKERRENGPFVDGSDFQRRLGLDSAVMEALAGYAVAAAPGRVPSFKAFARVRGRREFPESEGYRNGKFAGSPLQSYQRADFNFSDRIAGGFFAEKDPGEKRWNDETAGYIQIRNPSQTFRLTAGRFIAEAGRGLVLWNPAGLFRGADPSAPVRGTSSAVRGVASAGGNAALSGVALEWRRGTFRAAVCASKTRADASLDADGKITAIRTDGLHRTGSEIRGKSAAGESILAAHVQAGRAGLRFGASGLWTRYGAPVDAVDPERRPFGFSGKTNAVAGVDWDVSAGPLTGTGEFARSRSGGVAWTHGFAVDLSKIFFVVSFRRYGPDFQNPRASGFGGGSVQNETGWYFGLTYLASERTRIAGFADLFHSPVKTWLIPLPSDGAEWMVQAEHDWNRAVTLRFKARMRDGMRMEAVDGPAGTGDRILTDRYTRSMRLELEMKPRPGLRLRSRMETVKTEPGGGNPAPSRADSGVLFFEDILIRKSDRFSLSLRWTTFDTDSWDSRLVVLENDLPGTAALSSLYQKGHRWTAVLRWRFASDLAVSVKFGSTAHAFADSWGTGYDRITGNAESQIGVQLDWKR
jgi:DNA uptake protein ComE-like DNA-binding protein